MHPWWPCGGRNLAAVRAMVLRGARPAARAGRARRPRARAPARSWFASRRAACAAPTCTSWTASCPSRSCRSCRATRSSGRSSRAASASPPASASGSRGSARPAGAAATACRGARTCATHPTFTGYDRDGGYAELAVAVEAYALPLPGGLSDVEAAPLLCAGLIGYRALRMAGDAERLGLYGFGAAAHIVCQVARHQGRRVFAFTRADDADAQGFARELGAEWAGDAAGPRRRSSTRRSCSPRSATTCRPRSGRRAKGGTVVCAGHPHERHPVVSRTSSCGASASVRSVANLTRRDGEEFLALAPTVPVRTRVTEYPLERANEALDDLRAGRVTGFGRIVRRNEALHLLGNVRQPAPGRAPVQERPRRAQGGGPRPGGREVLRARRYCPTS